MDLPPEARPIAHPLGPLVYRVQTCRRGAVRGVAAAILAGGLTVLAVAASLSPDPAGLGTHRQLGLPGCNMIMLTGYPCPTCGMTTAFSHTVRGQWLWAMGVQPAGFLIALATIAAVLLSARSLMTGETWALNWYRVPAWKTVVLLVGVILAAWGYKIAMGVAAGMFPAHPF